MSLLGDLSDGLIFLLDLLHPSTCIFIWRLAIFGIEQVHMRRLACCLLFVFAELICGYLCCIRDFSTLHTSTLSTCIIFRFLEIAQQDTLRHTSSQCHIEKIAFSSLLRFLY